MAHLVELDHQNSPISCKGLSPLTLQQGSIGKHHLTIRIPAAIIVQHLHANRGRRDLPRPLDTLHLPKMASLDTRHWSHDWGIPLVPDVTGGMATLRVTMETAWG